MINYSEDRARLLAADLLRIGAVIVRPEQPFTWASGLISPVYCDNRLTLGYPDVRRRIRDGFAALLTEHRLQPEVIVGTATAGIPHAAWLSEALDLPLAYARSRPKEHGRRNQIDGLVPEGAASVIIEDLISTGGSSVGAVEAVRQANSRVLAVLSIFSYGLLAADRAFRTAGVPVYSLVHFDLLVQVAQQQGALSGDVLDTLAEWQQDPQAWSESRRHLVRPV